MNTNDVPQGDRELRGIVFLGGGTGGHLFPALAVAERACERHPQCRILFLRTRRSVEDQVFASWTFPTVSIELEPPSAGVASWLRFWRQARQAIPDIRDRLRGKFDVAVGLGGYASLPGIVAARRERIPVVLLEQNQWPGRVNRLLAPFVSAVSCPSAATAARLRGRTQVTGNPVRRSVIEAARGRQREAGPASRTVLVVGGSQGARAINRRVASALPELMDFRERIRWIHVTGDADKAIMEDCYRRGGWEARVIGFAPDLPWLLAESDLVIARAGGTTVSELAVVGVPSVLVPYPHHRDNHQRRNAEALVRAGGAQLLEESRFTPAALRALFEELLFSSPRLSAMRSASLGLAQPEAADAVLDLLIEVKESCLQDSASFS